MERHARGRDAGPPQYRITQRSAEDVTRKSFIEGRATLACRYKITTEGIQPPHPLGITPHPSHPASVSFPLPPGHPSQKRLTNDAHLPESLSAQQGSPARSETTVAGTTTSGRRC